jgi:hypothetical protein
LLLDFTVGVRNKKPGDSGEWRGALQC